MFAYSYHDVSLLLSTSALHCDVARTVDVDECAVNNGGCHQHADCTNTPGSLTCACIEGYVGDGLNCIRNVIPKMSCNLLYFT